MPLLWILLSRLQKAHRLTVLGLALSSPTCALQARREPRMLRRL